MPEGIQYAVFRTTQTTSIATPPRTLLSDPRRLAVTISVAVAVLMLVGKFTAYFLTGSTAIFSDAMESVVHLLATGFVGFSLWYSTQPPDTGHPYGHGKIAYFSAGFEGFLILIAAGSILYTAVHDFLTGPELSRLEIGFGIIAVLALINLGLGLYLIRTGRRFNNLVLVSNGKHVLTDMWTSLGVLVGIALVHITEVLWLDPAVAVLVALNIVWTGFGLIRQSVSGLMERADARYTSTIMNVLQKARTDGLITNFHQVRHRRVHDQLWIEYHLLFPENMTITNAHDRAHAVEDQIVDQFPEDEVFVTAHLEPEQHSEAHPVGHAEPVDPFRDLDTDTH